MIKPDWPAPPNVKALITERVGGVSIPPFQSFNLATHVGDEAAAVAANRAHLAQVTGVNHWQWLEQIHGTRVISVNSPIDEIPCADGASTQETGLALAILTADCLPVLLCNQAGTQVAALHAGWRGLAAGILMEGVGQFSCPPQEILAYLGPCISQQAFEVGPEVCRAFLDLGASFGGDWRGAFLPSSRAGYYFADLYQLARWHLQSLGLMEIYGGGYCTFGEAERFYSFRREGKTGRMASVIWLEKLR